MQYKTITLELIQQQPELHEQLRKSRKLLPTLSHLADQLRDHHRTLTKQLQRQRPQADETQLSSEAMEIAVRHFEEVLTSAPPVDGAELSLGEAIAYIKSRTSSA